MPDIPDLDSSFVSESEENNGTILLTPDMFDNPILPVDVIMFSEDIPALEIMDSEAVPGTMQINLQPQGCSELHSNLQVQGAKQTQSDRKSGSRICAQSYPQTQDTFHTGSFPQSQKQPEARTTTALQNDFKILPRDIPDPSPNDAVYTCPAGKQPQKMTGSANHLATGFPMVAGGSKSPKMRAAINNNTLDCTIDSQKENRAMPGRKKNFYVNQQESKAESKVTAKK